MEGKMEGKKNVISYLKKKCRSLKELDRIDDKSIIFSEERMDGFGNIKVVTLCDGYNVPWVLNRSVNICMSCQTRFNAFRRKHHCRACGIIVCNKCSKIRVNLPFITEKGGSRICTSCAKKTTVGTPLKALDTGLQLRDGWTILNEKDAVIEYPSPSTYSTTDPKSVSSYDNVFPSVTSTPETRGFIWKDHGLWETDLNSPAGTIDNAMRRSITCSKQCYLIMNGRVWEADTEDCEDCILSPACLEQIHKHKLIPSENKRRALKNVDENILVSKHSSPRSLDSSLGKKYPW